MLHLNFEPFPKLNTQRLLLREVSLDDAPEVLIQRSHPEIQKYIHRSPAQSMDEAIQFINKIILQQKNKQCITWAMTVKGENKLIGSICLWNIDDENNSAEVGYSLHPDFFKQGLMSEALKSVIDYGFHHMLALRIDAFTNKENRASLNLLAHNGFKRNLFLESTLEDKTELEYNQIFSITNTLH